MSVSIDSDWLWFPSSEDLTHTLFLPSVTRIILSVPLHMLSGKGNSEILQPMEKLSGFVTRIRPKYDRNLIAPNYVFVHRRAAHDVGKVEVRELPLSTYALRGRGV